MSLDYNLSPQTIILYNCSLCVLFVTKLPRKNNNKKIFSVCWWKLLYVVYSYYVTMTTDTTDQVPVLLLSSPVSHCHHAFCLETPTNCPKLIHVAFRLCLDTSNQSINANFTAYSFHLFLGSLFFFKHYQSIKGSIICFRT